MSKPLDETLSKELAKTIKSKPTKCFENAYKAALLTDGATYVQGFLTFPGEPYAPVEYAWIEVNDLIVDPTLPHLKKKTQELCYFPAQRLSVKELKAILEESEEDYPEDDPLPVYGSAPYEYYGEVMLGGKEYLQAFQEAEAKCLEFNKPKKQNNNGNSHSSV
jgi:hypothetical protein